MHRAFRTVFVFACAVTAILGFGASPAFAHNTFIDSSPANGDALETSPNTWSVTFEKSVPLNSASGVVINGDGIRTSLPSPRHGDTDSTVVFDFPPNLSGSINARWRLVGTDGHVISGRVSFVVQDSASDVPINSDGSATDTSITTTATTPIDAATFDDESVGAPQPIRVALRLANFLSLMTLGGLLFAERFVARRSTTSLVGLRFLQVGALGSALIPLIQLWIFSHDLGGNLGDALSLTPGVMLVVRSIAGFILLAGCQIASRQQNNLGQVQWQLATSWLVYLVALAYGGHSRSQGYSWLGIPADILHVTAISAWLGGLVALVFVILPSISIDQGIDSLKRFSRLAERAVIVVAITGIIQTLRLHGSIVTLFSTTHGLLLLSKLVLVAIIIRFASRNRSILNTSQSGDMTSNALAKSRVVKSALKEMVVASAVLAITAAMVGASLG